MPDTFLDLQDIRDHSAGGKAWGLSRLQLMGLAVPPAFVIHGAQGNHCPETLAQRYRALGSRPVAVRSSALGEDGASASFAGQYDTVLNVTGMEDLQRAISQCIASTGSDHARHYQQKQLDGASASMNVVVQNMVDARVAGVVFTVDPVSARRDLLVIDAVTGLGEALVSGEATPDHYGVNRDGVIVRRQLAGETPLLSETEIATIASQARAAAAHEELPLDLEWAIDQDGTLFWLQARPITTLPADLNAFDSVLPRPDDVLTISNISEMMPGAVCPLTASFTGWGIDYGLQHMQVTVGARGHIDHQWQVTAAAYGHLFLNLSGNAVMSAGVLGSSVEQTGQTLCGRIIPELKPMPPQPLWRRILNTGRLLRYCLTAPAVVERFGAELQAFEIEERPDSASMWAELESKSGFFDHCMAVHIQSSALSGFLCSIVENRVSGNANESTGEEQAEAMRLLAGATGVESALMLEQLDQLLDAIAAEPQAAQQFVAAPPADALHWLRGTAPLDADFAAFLLAHGHRGYRELCLRDPSWGDDPLPLIQSMQAAVHGRLVTGGHRQLHSSEINWADLGRDLRWLLPKAHNAIRRRERTKSQLVDLAHRFQQGFRHLGKLLVSEGRLPDADLLNFFSVAELPGFIAQCSAAEPGAAQPGAAQPGATQLTDAAVALAQARREALAFQQKLEFPEISVGMPQPLEPRTVDPADGVLQGRPASGGIVEGSARVAHTLAEAAALQPGEILITPITDIGWTPYFSLIGGLVTDLGSSVSHGAVIAREYGLPCVVNTRQGTRLFQTGDRVRLDGNSGTITLLARD
ncbi:MAG: PEP/pyruvate-binding domain-containing protein [Haliea sp.]